MTKRTRLFVLLGLVVALALAGGISYYASSKPDGLNKVAADNGLDKAQRQHSMDDSPLAGYSTRGVDNQRLSGGLAGVAGVAVTFLVASGVVVLVRHRRQRGRDHAESRR